VLVKSKRVRRGGAVKGFCFCRTSMGALCYGNPVTFAVFPVGDIGESCALKTYFLTNLHTISYEHFSLKKICYQNEYILYFNALQ
jgi:hypothetical protein